MDKMSKMMEAFINNPNPLFIQHPIVNNGLDVTRERIDILNGHRFRITVDGAAVEIRHEVKSCPLCKDSIFIEVKYEYISSPWVKYFTNTLLKKLS